MGCDDGFVVVPPLPACIAEVVHFLFVVFQIQLHAALGVTPGQFVGGQRPLAQAVLVFDRRVGGPGYGLLFLRVFNHVEQFVELVRYLFLPGAVSGVGLVEFPYLFACFHAVGVVLVFDVHDAQLRQDLLFDDAPARQFADGGLLPPHVFRRGEYGPHTGSLFF